MAQEAILRLVKDQVLALQEVAVMAHPVVAACQAEEAMVMVEHLLICSFSDVARTHLWLNGWDSTLEPYHNWAMKIRI